MNYTPEQAAFIASRVNRAKEEIRDDIASGRVPASVKTFSELHDSVDANEYGGFCEDNSVSALNALFPDPKPAADAFFTEAAVDAMNDVQNTVHAWLVAGRPVTLEMGTGVDDEGFVKPMLGFDHGGVFITDPTVSECSRFPVDPLTYYGLTAEQAAQFTKDQPDTDATLFPDIAELEQVAGTINLRKPAD